MPGLVSQLEPRHSSDWSAISTAYGDDIDSKTW